MIIESGYWNYYLAFRIDSYGKHLQEMNLKSTNSGLIAYISDQTVLVKNTLDEMFEKRKNNMLKYKKETSKYTAKMLKQMYMENELPEYFFDFDKDMNDMLEAAVRESIAHVSFINSGYMQMLNHFGKGKCEYYVLMPLKVYFSEWEFVYCPVYIQLLTNGNGLIKLQIPLKNIMSEAVSNYPLRRWFSQIKVWHELFEEDGEKSYKILVSDTEGVEDIICALQNYVQKLFSETIVDEKRFLGLETFVISESKECDINTIRDDDMDGIEQVYRLVYPENFAIDPNEKELKEFWTNTRFNASGIHVICGDRARIILYADVESLLEKRGRKEIVSKNEYLNHSVAATFDPYILLALAQKDNEMTIYRLSERDRHTINDKMVRYYSNANYLDSILLNVPKHGKKFYNEVRKMLDDCMVDFNEMIQRMRTIEEYKKTRLTEKQNDSINRFSLIFTVLFGLPLIQEMLLTIKMVLNIQKDIIPVLNSGHISFLIWCILLLVLLADIVERSLEYEGISIEDNSFVLSKIKKIIMFILIKTHLIQ